MNDSSHREILYCHMNCRSASSEMLHRNSVRFEVFAAVTMKNGVFWDVTS
jgi:hypothetical protein